MSPSFYNSASGFFSFCAVNGLSLSDKQRTLLSEYVQKLLFTNKRLNLISRKDEENIWTHHILHCTSLLFHGKFLSNSSILDLGTGGGLPGVVYAILDPSLHLTLLDATKKKVDAVSSIVEEIGLENVEIVWGRAEELNKKREYVGKHHYIVARAVAPLKKLLAWSFPFLTPPSSGNTGPTAAAGKCFPVPSLLAFKGGDITEEIKGLRRKREVKNVTSIDLGTQNSFSFLLDKKVVIVEF